MSRTLFDIGNDLLAFDEILEQNEGEISDDEAGKRLDAWFTDLQNEQSRKLDNYVNYIRTLEMEAVASKAEAEQYLTKARVRENRVRFLKERMRSYLAMQGKKELITQTNRKITIQNNGGILPMIVEETTDPEKVPVEYTRKELDNAKIREALMKGIQLEFAKLGERGTHLRIK